MSLTSPSSYASSIRSSVPESNCDCGRNEDVQVRLVCVACSVLLCDICQIDHCKQEGHTAVPNIMWDQSHNLQPPCDELAGAARSPTPPDQVCSTHFEVHDQFCLECDETACSKCRWNVHSDHQVQSLQSVANLVLAQVGEEISQIEAALDDVQQKKYETNESYREASADIKKLISKTRTAFKNREQELYAQAYANGGKQLSPLHVQKARLAKNLVYIEKLMSPSTSTSSSEEKQADFEILPVGVNLDDKYLRLHERASLVFVEGKVNAREVEDTGDVVVYGDEIDEDMPPPKPATSSNMSPKYRPIYGVRGRVIVNENRFNPSLVFGQSGSEKGELVRPWGVHCNYQGHIFVADRSNNRIQIFDENGRYLSMFGTFGEKPGQFNRPTSLTQTPDGDIVVADKDNHRIQVFDMTGKCLFTFGSKGTGDGEFSYPWDVACDAQGNIAVSDTRNNRVQLFDGKGKFLKAFPPKTNRGRKNNFNLPRGLSFTPEGNVIATDFENGQLIVIDRDFNSANYIGKNLFNRPQGVVCDDLGNIIVADSRYFRVQVFDPNLNLKWIFGTKGTKGGHFDVPSGICLNPKGRIIVVDYGNTRIQVF